MIYKKWRDLNIDPFSIEYKNIKLSNIMCVDIRIYNYLTNKKY